MKRSLAALLFALTTACSTTPATQPKADLPSPRLATAGHAQRVVLVSFDGLSADELQQFPAPAFNAMSAHATRVIPVTPTVTMTTHTAILTGAPPEKSGVVSNQFHIAGTPATTVAMGKDAEITAETLVEAAHRAGKRVGCMTFPTVDAKNPRRTADWGLLWPTPLSRARVVHLTRADFHALWMPEGWGAPVGRHPSFSPVLRARVEWSMPQKTNDWFDVLAYDTTNDQVQNYDTFYVEHGGSETRIDETGWFATSTRLDDGLYGSWSKVLEAQPTLYSMTIYEGEIMRNEGYPASFVRMIDDEIGFWPGFPDEGAVRALLAGRPGIDAATFVEQSDRLSDFLTRATVLAIHRMPFDLMLAYQPTIDESEHQFKLVLDTQQGSTPAHRAIAERVRRSAYAAFDSAVAQLSGAIDPSHDALVVTGDHGLAPADTEVRLNQLLVDWGFTSTSENSISDTTHWAAYATGNVAHLYRFSAPDDTNALVDKLAALKAPDGAPVFERIDRKTAVSHPNAGDLTVYAYPRFALSSALGEPFSKPLYFGQHGGLSSHPEFHTALGATGAGVVPGVVPVMQQTSIARFVCGLLGIPAPRNAE